MAALAGMEMIYMVVSGDMGHSVAKTEAKLA
ncbi:unnamed protein product, partial [marine sediment metagenome]